MPSKINPLLLFCILLSYTTSTAQVGHPVQSYGDSKLLQLSYAEIDSIAEIHYENGAYTEAIPYMQAGRAKAKKEFGTQDSTYAFYTADLGFYYNMSGQAKLAESAYKESISIREKVLGKYHSQLAESINNLAALYQSMGQYEQALPLYLESKNIKAKSLGLEHPGYANSLNNLAVLYENMGQYEQALPLYLESKNIRAKSLGLEHYDYAASLNNLALLYQGMGQYEQALPLFIQAKNGFAKSVGLEHPEYARSLNNLAGLYQGMGQYEQALPLYLQTIRIEAQSLGLEHPNYATSLNNLAVLYQSMGQYEQALPLYLQTKNIWGKSLGLQHPDYASSLNNLATLYQNMGQYEQALPLYLESKNIRAKSLGIEHPDYATSLNNLVELYQSMGQYEQAWKTIREAIKASSKLELYNELNSAWADSLLHADYSSNLHIENMIITLGFMDDLLKKDSLLTLKNPQALLGTDPQASLRTIKIIISDLAAALLIQLRDKHGSSEDKLRILSPISNWLLKSLKVLDKTKDANKAFEKAEQNKSVLLLEAAKSEKAYELGNLPDSLVRQEKFLIAKKEKLQANLLEKRPETEKDSLRSVLNATNQDLNAFVASIEKNYPKYAAFKYKHVDAKTKDIQTLLDTKTALLEYVIGDSVLYIFYVDKNELRWVEKVLDTKELTKKIKTLHGVLSDYKMAAEKAEESYQLYTNTAHWFYQNLVAPVLSKTPNSLGETNAKDIKQLIIVTDRELGHLPFEAFLVEPAPQTQTDYAKLHYLLNDFSISYNYSATLWKENKEAPKAKNNGQIFGFASNYEIHLDSVMKEVRLPTYQDLRKGLNPLPAARKEVELLSQNYSGFFAFDKEASEKTFKEKAGDYAIIHLAMHGLLDSKRPILSSLAFTEDSDSLQDNFLQAHEISKLNLNADLVILSACETGYGKFEKGNGIASLARAFMFAGASSLVVSLWQVNDFATSELMKYFYQNLADGMEKDVALQQAKLAYIKGAKGVLAHPAFWSPFIQIGNSRPIGVETRCIASVLLWAIGAGIILLIVGGFLWKRKKIG